MTLMGIDYMRQLQSVTSCDVILNFSSAPGTATLAYSNGYIYYNFNWITMIFIQSVHIKSRFPMIMLTIFSFLELKCYRCCLRIYRTPLVHVWDKLFQIFKPLLLKHASIFILPRTKIRDNHVIRPVTWWPYMRLCMVSKLHVWQPAPKIVWQEKQDGGQRSCCHGIFWRSICAETVYRLETTFMIFYNLCFKCRTS